MNALPPAAPDVTEAEPLARIAAQIGEITALLKGSNDGLSPSEAALIPEVKARAARPVAELDAVLTIGDHEMAFTVEIYGTHQPRFAGDREQPEEGEFVEIDRVMLVGGPNESADIYDALSWADLQTISDAVLSA